ncbi:hypothetical protein LWI29_036079 [Acer saccharum]|uniref:F-box domain-containing protein n=1 Tax=Acer saccharum TaxID=4024 RepID=A0AA39TFR7_ACESA|nr:hypothetical protein LWI29_036079 [Acer saccharum]
MEKSSSIDNIKLEVIEVQSSDVETKLGGVMTATTDSSPIDIKIGGTPMTNNEKPKIESLWCNLPGNVLISIIECLCYVDQIYFRAVCKDWRSKVYGSVRYSDNIPWILAVSKKDISSNLFVSISNQCYLYDPIHKQKYTIENQILYGAHIHASKFGWLLLSTNIRSTYFFRFYSPFTNKIIELPALDMKISAGKIFTNVIATFSTAPTSSDCVICVLSTGPPKKDVYGTSFFEEFCVSTCSPGGKIWNNVLLGTNGYKYHTRRISRIALVDGVLYFTFCELGCVSFVMGAFKLGLQEWKTYPYPCCLHCRMDCLIESEDNENLLKLYQDCYDLSWHVWQFNEAEKVWCELENLGNRMLFVSTATLTSLQLARSAKEEDREGMVSFANTVHVAHGYPPQLDYDETLHLGEKRGLFANAIQVEHSTYIPQLECSSPIYKTPDEHHPSIPQVENSSLIYMIPDDYYPLCQQIYEIYNWIDYEGLGLTWIQPPQIR